MNLDSRADVGLAVLRPLEYAFSGSGFLKPRREMIDDFRSTFLEASKMTELHEKGLWSGQFEKLLNVADEVAGSRKNIDEDLEGWKCLQAKIATLQGKTQAMISNISHTTDVVDKQERVFSLLQARAEAFEHFERQVQSMQGTHKHLQDNIEAMRLTTKSLSKSWVDFAREVSQKSGCALGKTTDYWFPHLNTWSTCMELLHNSLPLQQETADRFIALHQHLREKLPTLLDETLRLCFNMYGDILSSNHNADHDGPLSNISEGFRSWHEMCPWWPLSEEYSARDKVGSGQVWSHRNDKHGSRWHGTDPRSVSVVDQTCIQSGISYLDFGRGEPLGLETQVRDPHNADRVLIPTDDSDFYASRLSWVQIPDNLRDRVQFSHTTYDGKIPMSIVERGVYKRTSWIVKFPRPFGSGKVSVHPWLTGIKTSCYHVCAKVNVQVEDITCDRFTIRLETSSSTNLPYVKINYAAYETNPPIDTFQAELYRTGPSTVFERKHKFKPCFIAFPENKFSRRPALAAMMSTFQFVLGNYRLNLLYAATRDGVIIQAFPWGDTIPGDMDFQILAIANK